MLVSIRWSSRWWCFHHAVLLCGGFLLSTISVVADEPLDQHRSRRPVRELELISGERLPVEEVRCDGGGLVFRWNGDHHCRLPLALIRSVANVPGWLDRTEAAFEAASPRWTYRCDPPLSAGELVFWRRNEPGTDRLSDGLWRLSFRSGATFSDLELRLGDQGALTTNLPQGWRKTFSQPLRTSPDWSRVAIVWRDDRCEIQVDNALHTVFSIPPFPLRDVVLEAAPAAIRMEDLILREYRAELAAMSLPTRTTESLDAITLATGDQLFGQLAASQRTSTIALQGEQAAWSGDWSQAVRIDLARRPIPAHALAPVDGWRIDLPSSAALSLRNLRFGDRTTHHPWLGTLSWPFPPSNPVSRAGFGEFRWLEPDRRHLGDEIRDDLSPTVPVGTSLSGTIEFFELPRGRMWMMLDVAEMEPSGPNTIPMQPFLDVLRGGGLRTELVINDRVITDLNRFLRVRTPATHPERLWLPIPLTTWRLGTNTWALRQRPLSASQSQYDDAEVGRIALWTAPF